MTARFSAALLADVSAHPVRDYRPYQQPPENFFYGLYYLAVRGKARCCNRAARSPCSEVTSMKITPLAIPDVLLIQPEIVGDERGFFFESYSQRQFDALIGRRISFVQDNHSRSVKNVLRGLHYQIRQSQGKLVRVVQGEIFDVAVDIRKSSPTFGQWVGTRLSAQNRHQLWVPEGFAHGFVVLSDVAECLYKVNDYYAPEHERIIAWDDADIGVEWPLRGEPVLSAKDKTGIRLADAEVFA